MTREIIICETIRELRKSRSISQETLSAALQVSIQAVSKWETAVSLPDIGMLPQIADYFEVSVDELLFGVKPTSVEGAVDLEFPNDDKLRFVQLIGHRILSQDEFYELDDSPKIPLVIDQKNKNASLNVEIWGNADIEGNINGNVSTGSGSVDCVTVRGNAAIGSGTIKCANVGGDVALGDGNIKCVDVGGNVTSKTGDIKCANVSGNVTSKNGDVKCAKVNGDVSAGDCVTCTEISGDVTAQEVVYK